MNEDTYLSVLAHMLDSSLYPSGLKSKEGVFLYANKAYCKLVNVPNNIAGLTDREIPCDTAAFSDVFFYNKISMLSHIIKLSSSLMSIIMPMVLMHIVL